MENIILYLCSCLSCFIIITILCGLMDDRYNRTFANKYIYIGTELGITFGVAVVNLVHNEILNITVWIVAVGFVAYILYYEDFIKPVKRVLECEISMGVITVCESLGVGLADWFLELLDIEIREKIMLVCLETAFSKIIMIFLYFMAVGKLMKKRPAPFTKLQYVFNCIILGYTFIDIIVIVDNMNNKPNNYFLVLNLGCIVLADLFMIYFIKVMYEKSFLEYEVKSMEKQADLQYKYYVRQEQKYNKTLGLLHDINKHIKSIEQLYLNGNTETAVEYTKQISGMLQPLITVKYTGNPILDILLADYLSIMGEKQIDFDIQVDNVKMDFMDAMDITTIFGNLFDNAIEAYDNIDNNKKIFLKIGAYHKMISIRIENNCTAVKWKNGVPVSEKGQNHGMGLLNVRRSVEKYDGNIKLKVEDKKFIVDIFLNS